jgi:hypothetical protein
MIDRRHLDQLVLDVELILISVVQAVALSTLAIESTSLMREPELLVVLFLATGFLFVLSFWSVAIIHAISFITWPMDLVHYFFYFGIALLECLMFGQLEHPDAWFAYSAGCFALSLLLYLYDYRLILGRRAEFADTEPRRALYEHIVRRQRLEMRVLIPAGLAFNVVAWALVRASPGAAPALAVLQLAFSVFFVVLFVRSFDERQRRITATARLD